MKLEQVIAGDIVVYYSEQGDPNHSGIVVETGGGLLVPIICSKWSNAGEYVHGLRVKKTVSGTII